MNPIPHCGRCRADLTEPESVEITVDTADVAFAVVTAIEHGQVRDVDGLLSRGHRGLARCAICRWEIEYV